MSNYSYAGAAGNWSALAAAIDEDLTLRHEVQSDGPAHAFSHNTTSYATITSDSIPDIEADDTIVVIASLNCSCSSAADNWTLVIDFGGGAATSPIKKWTAHGTSSGGATDVITMVGVFKDQAAGTHTIALQVKATSAPAGIFHADSCDIHTLILKQRA